ncbi:hypothetical protein KY290_004907 [Solanum tuberosum]|uniref:Uncharacterized protein n=1 Tax=Solanum tuberosum TaxID=4113 RepID=A0ABQ7WCJ4_SOLTU|nr:hypothetical protein KY284_005025 [Solanum tuberosum]KAH0778480.1 hypothetical protein KY290_004907 [Solanum tuberosum]
MLVFFIRIRPSKLEKAATLTRQHRQRFQTAEQLALRAFPRLPPLFCLSRTDPITLTSPFFLFLTTTPNSFLLLPRKETRRLKNSNGFYPKIALIFPINSSLCSRDEDKVLRLVL